MGNRNDFSYTIFITEKEIDKAVQVSNQFYQHVSKYPIMERTIIKNGKSIKYYANLLKFAALMCKSLELCEKKRILLSPLLQSYLNNYRW